MDEGTVRSPWSGMDDFHPWVQLQPLLRPPPPVGRMEVLLLRVPISAFVLGSFAILCFLDLQSTLILLIFHWLVMVIHVHQFWMTFFHWQKKRTDQVVHPFLLLLAVLLHPGSDSRWLCLLSLLLFLLLLMLAHLVVTLDSDRGDGDDENDGYAPAVREEWIGGWETKKKLVKYKNGEEEGEREQESKVWVKKR